MEKNFYHEPHEQTRTFGTGIVVVCKINGVICGRNLRPQKICYILFGFYANP